jgi:hypothetical protein
MVMGQKDTMAQAVYLAQLEAAKGKCQCNVCKILRKGADNAAAAFLAEKPVNPEKLAAAAAALGPASEEV